METKQGIKKVREGRVISTKMAKTAVVSLKTKKRHPKYGKFITRVKKYYAHDEKSQCGVGDLVQIVECRPLSRLKRWRVQSIVEKAVV